MRYLTGEDVLVIHSEIIEESGGHHGVRDLILFGSLIERPKGTFGGAELYPDIYSKGSVYLEGFARHHVFVDGNKRTAFATAAFFFSLNKHELNPSNKEVEDFMIRVVTEKLSIESIATWLKKNSKKIK